MDFQKCSICGKLKYITYHVTDILPDGVKSYEMCKSCGEQYMTQPESPKPLDLSHIKTPEQLLNLISMHQSIETTPPCECGMTDEEFEKKGRFGCPKCYTHFKDKMEKYVYPYHKARQHVGKRPKAQIEKQLMSDPVEKLKILRLRLARAIEVEKYEEAALLKKQIEDHLGNAS